MAHCDQIHAKCYSIQQQLNSERHIHKHTHIQPLYSHYTGQPVLAGIPNEKLEDFVGTKFYYLHALADGN